MVSNRNHHGITEDRQTVLITEGGCPTEGEVGGSSDLFQRAV